MEKYQIYTKSIFCFICLMLQTLLSPATNYYSVKSGNWSSSSTWSTPSAPSYTISNTTDTIFINSGHSVTFSQEVHLYGVMVVNNGSLIDDNGKKNIIIESTGQIIVIGGAIIDNLTNNGNINLEGEMTINGSSENTGTIYIAPTGSFESAGDFSNSGDISNEGAIALSGSLTNSGTITNTGNLEVENLTVTLTGLLDNQNILNVVNDVQNDGEIGNNGIIAVGGDFNNTSNTTLNNSGDIIIEGVLTNTGTIHNDGTIVDNGGTVLPISLLNFTASASTTTIRFSWSTATETNNDYFTLEKSSDGVVYYPLARIKGAGNSNHTLLYSWVETTKLSDNLEYYRLRQTDYDGKNSVSSRIVIHGRNNQQGISMPNVCNAGSALELSLPYLSGWEVQIFDMNARLRLQKRFNTKTGSIDLIGLNSGTYLVKIANGSELYVEKLIIK